MTLSSIPFPGPLQIPPSERKQGLLNDLFLYLPETGVFDNPESETHSLLVIALLALKNEELESLISQAEGDPEGFRKAIWELLRITSLSRKSIDAILMRRLTR